MKAELIFLNKAKNGLLPILRLSLTSGYWLEIRLPKLLPS